MGKLVFSRVWRWLTVTATVAVALIGGVVPAAGEELLAATTATAGSAITATAGSAITATAGSAITATAGSAITETAGSAITVTAGSGAGTPLTVDARPAPVAAVE